MSQVFTVSLAQLTLHIPRESLPKRLGGTAPHSHVAWLQLCTSVTHNQNPNLNTYFSPPKKRVPLQGTRGSVSGRSLSSDMSDSLMISDIDSEESKETVNEKHSSEEKEKDDDGNEKEVNVEKEGLGINGSVKRRRESDTMQQKDLVNSLDGPPKDQSNSQIDNNSDYPPKKRPVSENSNKLYESSIHKPPDSDGLNIEELSVHCQQLKRQGLFQEYALIKMEPPAGTFTVSK